MKKGNKESFKDMKKEADKKSSPPFAKKASGGSVFSSAGGGSADKHPFACAAKPGKR